jgi:hypothetical protein
MKISKEDLASLVQKVLVEEATKANIGIDSTLLNTVIKDLTKVKENKVDMRESLTASQFDEFNKALNKLYSLLQDAK